MTMEIQMNMKIGDEIEDEDEDADTYGTKMMIEDEDGG